jgi:predicted nucleic acid-binding protein
MNEFLDTNVILRFLLQDHPEHSAPSTALFHQLETGQIQLVTSHAVITEVVHVLSSRTLYAMSRVDIRDRLLPLLSWPSLVISEKQSLVRALDIYILATIDFVDALMIAQMEHDQLHTVVSFDRDFDKFQHIRRREPS